MKSAAPNTTYEISEYGWSKGLTVANVWNFIPQICKESFIGDFNDPVLLRYDGNASHANLEIMKRIIERNTILFILPPYASNALQTTVWLLSKRVQLVYGKTMWKCYYEVWHWCCIWSGISQINDLNYYYYCIKHGISRFYNRLFMKKGFSV